MRTNAVFTCAFLFVALTGQSSPARSASENGFDGPSHFYVSGVGSDDALNIRSAPDANSTVVGVIPYNGKGIRNLGCNDSSFEEWFGAGAKERAEIFNKRWCQVDFKGKTGWVRGKFLREQMEEPVVEKQVAGEATQKPNDSNPEPVAAPDASPARLADVPVRSAKNAISILGLKWSQSLSENLEVLKARGYACKYREGVSVESCDGSELCAFYTAQHNQFAPVADCESNDGPVVFYRDTIVFNCRVFQMCDYSVEEASQMLVDTIDGVDQVEIRSLIIHGNAQIKACGRGVEGDEICLGSFPGASEKFFALNLNKGSLGKKVGFQ